MLRMMICITFSSGFFGDKCLLKFKILYCRIPYTLGTLPNLKAIVLDGNPMKGIRRDIIMVSLLYQFCFLSCCHT